MRKGAKVRLVSMPTGVDSRDSPVTVGHQYEVIDVSGSCLITTSDVSGEYVHLWRGRFVEVNDTEGA